MYRTSKEQCVKDVLTDLSAIKFDDHHFRALAPKLGLLTDLEIGVIDDEKPSRKMCKFLNLMQKKTDWFETFLRILDELELLPLKKEVIDRYWLYIGQALHRDYPDLTKKLDIPDKATTLHGVTEANAVLNNPHFNDTEDEILCGEC